MKKLTLILSMLSLFLLTGCTKEYAGVTVSSTDYKKISSYTKDASSLVEALDNYNPHGDNTDIKEKISETTSHLKPKDAKEHKSHLLDSLDSDAEDNVIGAASGTLYALLFTTADFTGKLTPKTSMKDRETIVDKILKDINYHVATDKAKTLIDKHSESVEDNLDSIYNDVKKSGLI